MEKNIFLLFIFVAPILLTSCISESSRRGNNSSTTASNNGNQSNSAGSTISVVARATPLAALVEIRHFVDPRDGSYQTKLALPKNFGGELYLGGLNIPAMVDRIVRVRFYFGKDLSSVTVPATIARAEGLTPQTDIQLLVMDFSARPLEDVRLLYDLYDYSGNNISPVSDVYSKNLYCRGLALEYDPTWDPDENESSNYNIFECDSPGDKCLYAYAKVKDSGPVNENGYTFLPTEPLIDIGSGDFDVNSTDTNLLLTRNNQNVKKCLPDNGVLDYRVINNDYIEIIYNGVGSTGRAGIGTRILSFIQNGQFVYYTYQGPYRILSKSSWVLKDGAAIGPNGLFAGTIANSGSIDQGIYSFLFPRAGKLELGANVSYVGSTTPFPTALASAGNSFQNEYRGIDSLVNAGESLWVDGCNLRVSNYDESRNEGINSCNITGKIEIVTTDPDTGEESVLSSTSDVKLQLIRPSVLNSDEDEALYQSFKTCSTDRTCAQGECCFNKRCWSKTLVSQCKDESNSIGNGRVGDICSTDYDCSTLCCSTGTGRCAVHNTLLSEPVYCSKPSGAFCVSKEWCRRQSIRNCFIVKTGVSTTGETTCALRCYHFLTFGDCVNGVCVAPRVPDVPSFDPNSPNCANAIDYTSTLNNQFDF